MAMWVFSSPGTAALGEPGGGYPWAPLSITAHPCALLCIPPCNPRQTSGGLLGKTWKEMPLGWLSLSCASDNCFFSQIRFYLSPEMKAAASSRALQCWPQPVFLWRGAASPCPAQPNLLLLGPSVGHKTPCASIAFVPKLSSGHIPAALQALLGHTSLGTTRHCHH